MMRDRLEAAFRFLVLVGVVVCAWLWLRGWTGAQDHVRGHQIAVDAVALERALLAQVTLPSGSYVAHCRTAPEGCEGRMHRLAGLFARAGAERTVDPWLLAAIAMRESGGNPAARGARGERGVMQLHPRSPWGRRAREACRRSPEDCDAAQIEEAAAVLTSAIRRCGTEASALGAYNRGVCGETRYSRAVLARRASMQRRGS